MKAGNSSEDHMKDMLKDIAALKTAVVGDVILDHYVWGDVGRISPEAPVPVVEISRDTYSGGGAANAALNAKALGAQTEVAGWIGDDEAGRKLVGIFDDAGVIFRSDVFTSDLPTIQKTRVIVQHQQLCRLDRESPATNNPDARSKTLKALLKSAEECDVVILSDYAKGFLDAETVNAVATAARSAGRFVSLDPKPGSHLDAKGFDLITPNRTEAAQLAGVHLEKGKGFPADKVCEALWKRYEPKYLVITMGEEGLLLGENGKITESIPTVAREVFDVSGAGDTVIVALSLALAAGSTLTEAAHFANAAAGVVIGKLGTATASPAEILAYAAEQ